MVMRYIISIMGFLLTFMSCSSDKCDVRALCVRDEIGNYIIKWETNPQIKGTVKVYVSDTPDKFDMSQPVIYADIQNGVARYVTQDNLKRKYFRITFNDVCPQDIAARYSFMDRIQNFRDLGGYPAQKGKQVRWGMIYRSGCISQYSDRDSIRLLLSGIKTIIDLRPQEEINERPIHFPNVKVISMPILDGNKEDFLERLMENKVRKRDGKIYLEDTYIRFVTECSESYAQVLQIFLDEANYPILLQGTLGKDRVGYLSALLLTMLGVPYDSVLKDYLASNQYIDPSFMSQTVSSLSSDAQETMTTLLLVDESFLDIAYKEIDKQFGSFKEYLEDELDLSAKKQEKLKDILLR